MGSDLPTIFGAIANDIATAANLAGGASIGLVAQQFLSRITKKRADEATKILIDEVRQGLRSLTDPEIEEVVSICYRYFRAAKEGTARLNLRLMARIIAGRIEAKALVADEFLRDADILASLSRDEVIMLGTLCCQMAKAKFNGNDQRYSALFASIGPLLIPRVFPTSEDFVATASALIRTGYLVPHPAIGGSNNFEISSALVRLNQLARLDQFRFSTTE